MTDPVDLVVVANRLPVDRVVADDGTLTWRHSPGGLVTAMEPVMHRHEGAWVGWDGGPDGPDDVFDQDGITLVPVPLSAQRLRQRGYSGRRQADPRAQVRHGAHHAAAADPPRDGLRRHARHQRDLGGGAPRDKRRDLGERLGLDGN